MVKNGEERMANDACSSSTYAMLHSIYGVQMWTGGNKR